MGIIVKKRIDVSGIKKGDVIDVKDLEKITGHKRGTIAYQFAVFQFAQRLQVELSEIGNPATVCQRQDSIHILDDADATDYNIRRFETHRAQLAKRHEKLAEVDVGNLTQQHAEAHQRRLAYTGCVISAIQSARRRQKQIEGK